jgi:uncharacterized membrane protein
MRFEFFRLLLLLPASLLAMRYYEYVTVQTFTVVGISALLIVLISTIGLPMAMRLASIDDSKVTNNQ